MAKQARYCKKCRKQRDHDYHVAYSKDYNKRPENLHYGRKVSANFRKKHPNRVKKIQDERGLAYAYQYHVKRKLDVFRAYAKNVDFIVCATCGFDDFRALQIDHINGDGAKQKRELRGINLYTWLRQQNYPKGYQVLCANCNWIKRHKNNEN